MQAVRDRLNRLKAGPATTFENLTLIPLIDELAGAAPDYATLDEAIRDGWVRVTEVDEGGSVPQLKFANSGDRSVLMMDGEELVGAKQNRILNLTILAPAGQTLIIPVSCVEHGRWARTTATLASAGHALYAELRARKSQQVTMARAVGAGPRTDQRAVWDHIAEKCSSLGSHSPTGAMEEMFRDRGAQLDDYVRAFRALDDQAGAIFAINGQLIGLDLFEHPSILAQMLEKLVRSYALDAIDRLGIAYQEIPAQEVRRFMTEVAEAGTQSYPSVGMGQDVRIESEGVTGGALVLKDRVVHLSAFRSEPRRGRSDDWRRGRIARSSRRRGNRID
jgi:hypothetical protein